MSNLIGRMNMGWAFSFLFLAFGITLSVYTCEMKPAYAGEDKKPSPAAAIPLPQQAARELIQASDDAATLKLQAEAATARATAAQLLYDKLYYKAALDLHVDLELYKIKRQGDSVLFVLKKEDSQSETSKTSSPANSP